MSVHSPDIQISPNFLYVLSVAVARSFSDDNAIRYVLLALWITSCVFPAAGVWRDSLARRAERVADYVSRGARGRARLPGKSEAKCAIVDCRVPL